MCGRVEVHALLPAAAFTKRGKPTSSAISTRLALSCEIGESVAVRNVGRPAAFAAASALTLFPASSSTRAVGPTNVSPFVSQAAARSGDSERKPYPG